MSDQVAASLCVICSQDGTVRIGTWVLDGIAYCDDHLPACPVTDEGIIAW